MTTPRSVVMAAWWMIVITSISGCITDEVPADPGSDRDGVLVVAEYDAGPYGDSPEDTYPGNREAGFQRGQMARDAILTVQIIRGTERVESTEAAGKSGLYGDGSASKASGSSPCPSGYRCDGVEVKDAYEISSEPGAYYLPLGHDGQVILRFKEPTEGVKFLIKGEAPGVASDCGEGNYHSSPGEATSEPAQDPPFEFPGPVEIRIPYVVMCSSQWP